MRLIDADALPVCKEYCVDEAGFGASFCVVHKEHIDNAPTIEAAPVVHGEWSTIEDDYVGMIALQCSECNQEYWFEDDPPLKIYNYCPNCGARMDGENHGQV